MRLKYGATESKNFFRLKTTVAQFFFYNFHSFLVFYINFLQNVLSEYNQKKVVKQKSTKKRLGCYCQKVHSFGIEVFLFRYNRADVKGHFQPTPFFFFFLLPNCLDQNLSHVFGFRKFLSKKNKKKKGLENRQTSTKLKVNSAFHFSLFFLIVLNY